MNIAETMERVHATACLKGWWDNDDPMAPRVAIEKLCLIHSEVSEAVEEVRNGNLDTKVRFEGDKPVGYAVELADSVIRIFDLAKAQGINLDEVIDIKANYNETRPVRHGGKLA